MVRSARSRRRALTAVVLIGLAGWLAAPAAGADPTPSTATAPPGASSSAAAPPNTAPAITGSSTIPSSTSPAGATSTTSPVATTTLAPGPASSAAPVAPPYDLATIAADQQQAVRLQFTATVGPAAQALGQAQNALAAAQEKLNADEQTSTDAATTATLAALALHRDLRAKQQADAVNAQAIATLDQARHGLVTIAVQLYVGNPAAAPTQSLEQLQEEGVAQEFLRTAIAQIAGRVQKDRAAQAVTQRAADTAGSRVEADATALSHTQQTAQQAAAAIGPDTQGVERAQGTLNSATAAYQVAARPLDAALAAFTAPDPAPSVSILGTPALDAQQLADWFNSTGFVDLTATPIQQLAGWYITEGNREGVRGDVAFAQSIVETGGFSSPDAVSLNNYAGIGHCDSCASGGKFPSAQLGIRAQMQLLRTYATPGLTAAALPDRPVTALVTPQRDINRGCCPEWTQLTRHWATSTTYGAEILNVYQRMLAYTVNAGNQPNNLLLTP